MRRCNVWVVHVLAAALAWSTLHCGRGSDCLRYSDCDEGLTCSAGQCVPPGATDSTDGAATSPMPDVDPLDASAASDADDPMDAANEQDAHDDAEAGDGDSAARDATTDS